LVILFLVWYDKSLIFWLVLVLVGFYEHFTNYPFPSTCMSYFYCCPFIFLVGFIAFWFVLWVFGYLLFFLLVFCFFSDQFYLIDLSYVYNFMTFIKNQSKIMLFYNKNKNFFAILDNFSCWIFIKNKIFFRKLLKINKSNKIN